MHRELAVFKTFLVIGLIAVGGLLSACGDDDSTTTTATQPKRAFVNAGDAICLRENSKIRAQAIAEQKKSGFSSDRKKQQELIAAIIIPAQERQVEGLEQLDPPATGQAEVNAFLKKFDEVIAETKRRPDIVLKQADLYEELRLAGEAAGFKVCGV